MCNCTSGLVTKCHYSDPEMNSLCDCNCHRLPPPAEEKSFPGKDCPANSWSPEVESVMVIRVVSHRGCGKAECCPIRHVTSWFTLDGKLITEEDSYA